MSVFLTDTSTPEIYTYRNTLSLHDALPIFTAPAPVEPELEVFDQQIVCRHVTARLRRRRGPTRCACRRPCPCGRWSTRPWCVRAARSEEHTSELQSLMRI